MTKHHLGELTELIRMEHETEYAEDESSFVVGRSVRYIVEGSSVPKAFERATSILSGKTVTQFNQITTGNPGEDPARGVGYAAGVTFGRNVLGNTSIVPRLIVMPEEDNPDVDIAGEVDLVDLAAEGSVRRQEMAAAALQDQTGPETLTVAIVASGEGVAEGFTDDIEEHFGYDSTTNKSIVHEQADRQIDTCYGRKETLLDKVLNDFPETKKKEDETDDVYDPVTQRHQCNLCEKRSYNARKDLYRHIRKEHPAQARELILEIRQDMKAARRERSLAAASTDNDAAFSVTCTERDEASTERDEAFTETDAAFSVACTECGNPTEPSQRDRYLCRCLSCDRKSRERKQGNKSGKSGCTATVLTKEANSKRFSKESGKSGKAPEESAWWEEGTQPEVEEPEPEAEMDAASDIESLLKEEDHSNLDEQRGGDINYEELMDSDDDDDPGGRDITKYNNGTKQTQCETCFRYFSSQSKLKSHRNTPHRCPVCCKIFSSRVRLVQHSRFHGNKRKMKMIYSRSKKSTTTDCVKTKRRRKILKQDCGNLEQENTINKPQPAALKQEKPSDERPEEQVRRSSRKTKGINRKYGTTIVKIETTGDDVDNNTDDDEEFIPERWDVENDDDDDDGVLEEIKEEEIEKKKKYSPRKARKGRPSGSGRRRGKFPCTECNKDIGSAQGLRNHLRGHVGYKKRYRPPPQSKCEKCGVEITSFQGYQNHMRVHQFDEESFVCDICHKHFSSREKLEDHGLLHEDVKLRALDTHDIDQFFTCKLCVHRLYKYKMRSQLYRHFRVHHPASAKSLMEEEMRIRRIGKAIRIIKEKQSTQRKIRSGDNVSVSGKTELGAIFGENNTSETRDNATKSGDCGEEVQDLKNVTRVFSDVSNILANNGNSIQDETMKEEKEGGNGENRKKNKEDNSEMDNIDQSSVTEISNECLNCGKNFPDQKSLCNHAIACSVQLQKYVSHMEKRWTDAKRYSMKRLEASRRILEFTCGSCGEKFTVKSKLRRHITDKHGDRKMNDCQVCGQDFQSSEELVNHVTIHPEYQPRNVLCAKCGKRFSSQIQFEAHERKLCGPAEQCDICGRIFKFAITLERHKKRCHVEKDYYVADSTVLQEARMRDKSVCAVCNEKFKDEAAAKTHLKSEHSEEEAQKPFSCSTCGDRFKRYANLIHHKLIHTGEKPYKCKICNAGFRSVSILTQHKYRHTTTKRFKCSVCGAQFIKLYALKVHLARHTTQLNCPACHRVFQSQDSLEEHYRIHTGDRPFKCSYCGEGFTSLRYVNRHMTVKHSDVEVTVRTTQFTCDVPDCDFSCTHLSTLRYHKLRHTGEKPYECDVCGKCFRSSSRMNEHKRVHTGARPYKCQYCDEFFSNSTSVRRHERRHLQTNNFNRIAKRSESKGPHVCDWCGKVFKKKNDHSKHIRVHTGEMPYQCKYCLRKFRTNSAWRRHEREHTGEAPRFVGDCMCNVCGKRVAKNQITAHMQLHRGDKPFECDFCDETFESKQALSGHHKKVHAKEKTVYQCTLCCENFKDHTKWKHHMMLHTGEKPEKCDVCGKCFRLKKELKRHLLGHSEPQHVCPYCKKAVRTPSQLKHHIRTHTGEKPHKCDECDRTFNQAYALKRHMMTHTDEKPHVCEECDSAYKTLDALQRHQRKKHGFVSATKRFPCPLCDREFLSAWHLDEHIKFHAGTRPHKCSYCERTFNCQLDLENHTPLHTGGFKYECEQCGRGFKTEVECAEHLGTHTEDTKSYPCKFCSETFTTTVQLRRHVDSHITLQDGQVFVLGSGEPTTVLEIVTDESPEEVVNRIHSNQLEIVTDESPQEVVNRIHSNQLEIVTEEQPQTVVETTTISIATTTQ